MFKWTLIPSGWVKVNPSISIDKILRIGMLILFSFPFHFNIVTKQTITIRVIELKNKRKDQVEIKETKGDR